MLLMPFFDFPPGWLAFAAAVLLYRPGTVLFDNRLRLYSGLPVDHRIVRLSP